MKQGAHSGGPCGSDKEWPGEPFSLVVKVDGEKFSESVRWGLFLENLVGVGRWQSSENKRVRWEGTRGQL